MRKASDLPYYPRFIFNCDDGNCLSTGDLDVFEFIKDKGSEYEITDFKSGQKIEISWINENEEQELKTYIVDRIEIKQIKYDIDEPTYGLNLNDCQGVVGKAKKWLMEIYIFLKFDN